MSVPSIYEENFKPKVGNYLGLQTTKGFHLSLLITEVISICCEEKENGKSERFKLTKPRISQCQEILLLDLHEVIVC